MQRNLNLIKNKNQLFCLGLLRLNTYFPGICEGSGLIEEKREIVPKKWLFTCLLLWTKELLVKKREFVCFYEVLLSLISQVFFLNSE